MQIHVYESTPAMGAAAADLAESRIRDLAATNRLVPVVFATGASQLETLRALTRMTDLPWHQVVGFHMDEYVGIDAEHPASFRRYLREEIAGKAPLAHFHFLEGDATDLSAVLRGYGELLQRFPPKLCLLGIGENGHLAFNDPGEANFEDPETVKIVELDDVCRRQQVNEGWFETMDEVPHRAVTLSIPALLRIPELIGSVPERRKAAIVRRTLEDPISTDCPATILRTHPNAALFLDRDSASLLRPPIPAVTNA